MQEKQVIMRFIIGVSEICAVTASSYPDKNGWLILLKGETISFDS